jgi:hypothetical protein
METNACPQMKTICPQCLYGNILWNFHRGDPQDETGCSSPDYWEGVCECGKKFYCETHPEEEDD